MTGWVVVCPVDGIDPEDVLRFDHSGRTFAICRAPSGEVFAIDGLCSHERVHLADGLVIGDTIECPRHNGRFNYRTGAAIRAPACAALSTYPARVRDGVIEIAPGDSA